MKSEYSPKSVGIQAASYCKYAGAVKSSIDYVANTGCVPLNLRVRSFLFGKGKVIFKVAEKTTYSALDVFHPAVQLLCFGAILVFCMAAFHPVYLSLSLLSAFSFSVYLKGWRASLRSMTWQLPLIALTAFINPLFSSSGSTELFSLGKKVFYQESFMFGIGMGVMLVSMMLWFANAAWVLSSDKVMAVFGKKAPVLALIISMTMRSVPRFVNQGTQISETAKACSAAQEKTKKDKTGARIRITSVLMGWSMENSLETADVMRARGWGSRGRRTTYQRYSFHKHDAFATGALALLIIGNAIFAWTLCSSYHFYPVMDSLFLRGEYLVYVALVFAPLVFCLLDDLRWKRETYE